MEIKLKTLTPIWTGGVETGRMGRLHETSIIGSLRWWYEAIVRGLGDEACDVTKHEHELSGDRLRRYEAARQNGKDWWEALDEAGICDACKVFGTTEWRRRFRLEVESDCAQAIWTPTGRMLNIRPPDRNRGWFLPPGWLGTLTLNLDGDGRMLSLMAALLLFLERWGSIGAKPQLGYGVFRIENREQIQSRAQDWAWEVPNARKASAQLPDLRRFGFFRYRFKPDKPGWWTRVVGIERVASQVQPLVSRYHTVPVSPALKNEWRFHRWQGSRESERAVFGSLRPNRQRSRVAVSWAYQQGEEWEVRGWVWLPSRRQWADAAWEILAEQDGWETALRVRGNLETRRLEAKEEVRRFLEETK